MRILPTVALAVVLMTGVVHPQQPDPGTPVMTEITAGVYHYFQNLYSSLVVVTDEGVIVTDPSGEERAAAMREAIRAVTDMPVRKVIYSHDHFDHSRGGRIFEEEGAEFIAHEKCVELMSRDLEDRVVLPDTTYSDTKRVTLGGRTVDLHYFGPNDGDCMSVIHMPEERVLVAVDWHLQGYVNEPFRLHAHNYVAILNTLRRVRDELEFDFVISGHMPQSSPAQFEEDLRFNEALFDAVWEGMQAGRSVDELKEAVELPEFSHWLGYERNLAAHVERMAYSIWHGN